MCSSTLLLHVYVVAFSCGSIHLHCKSCDYETVKEWSFLDLSDDTSVLKVSADPDI